MPELPEVEVVRRGLADHALGARIAQASVTGHRVARRFEPGPDALASLITGRTITAARRRGKYLWLVLDEVEALIVHLGMSGQMLVADAASEAPRHTHASFVLDRGGREPRVLRFVDQRTFGSLTPDALVADPWGGSDPVPASLSHIAPDPFEECFDPAAAARRARTKQVAVKRILLDQSWVSGIGNIYADEALWLAGLHGERRGSALPARQWVDLLHHARVVMDSALAQGGTSFDALYVNVNGASGYFERSLNAYGRAGQPCRRCAAEMVRMSFMNRSSTFCPSCQRPPRGRR